MSEEKKEATGAKKLFVVDVSVSMPVYAESEEEAQEIALDNYRDEDMFMADARPMTEWDIKGEFNGANPWCKDWKNAPDKTVNQLWEEQEKARKFAEEEARQRKLFDDDPVSADEKVIEVKTIPLSDEDKDELSTGSPAIGPAR